MNKKNLKMNTKNLKMNTKNLKMNKKKLIIYLFIPLSLSLLLLCNEYKQNKVSELENKLKKESKKNLIFKKIDDCLAIHYAIMERNDYYNKYGKGKFIEFTEKENFDEKDIEKEIGDKCNAKNCSYLLMDNNFPLQFNYKNNDEKEKKIFEIFKYCYKYNKPPLLIKVIKSSQVL